MKRLDAIGCFAAELEVVLDRVAEVISQNTPMIMLGMGAGPGADAQYLFSEDVLGHTEGHKPRRNQEINKRRRRACGLAGGQWSRRRVQRNNLRA